MLNFLYTAHPLVVLSIGIVLGTLYTLALYRISGRGDSRA